MDEMKIKSGFLRGIISRIIEKTIEKKIGRKIDFKLNDLDVSIKEQANLHIDLELVMSKDELKDLIFDKVGL